MRLALLQEQWGEQLRPTLLMLLGSVAFVLLIACANAANLLLARASVRQKELAIRAALGASRFRLIRQLLTESLLMALLSGAAGLLLAFWGIKLLNGLISYAVVNRVDEFRLEVSVLGFTLMISLLTGIVFGLAPALQSSKLDLSESIKEGAGGATGGIRGGRLRDILVVCEITLAVVLLIGAGLMIRSVLRLYAVDRGLNTDNVLTMQVFLPKTKYPGGRQVASFYQRILLRVQTLPGVESASLINYPPLGLISPTVPCTASDRQANSGSNSSCNDTSHFTYGVCIERHYVVRFLHEGRPNERYLGAGHQAPRSPSKGPTRHLNHVCFYRWRKRA